VKKKSINQPAQRIRHRDRLRRALGASARARRSGRSLPTVGGEKRTSRPIFGEANRNNSVVVKIPRTFSFLENPDGALDLLDRIKTHVEDEKVRHLRISHEKCSKLDLCAEAIMDTFLMRARVRRKGTAHPLYVGGQTSDNSFDVNVMLAAAGLPHRLGLKDFEIPEELTRLFNTFEMQEGSASHNDSSKNRNRCGTSLTNYFNVCLGTEHFQLSEGGEHDIACLLTEVIGNAEEHGGPWHATGFWDGRKFKTDKGVAGVCHIAIFNSGSSIYESILRPDSSDDLRVKLSALSADHESKGYFKRSGGAWNEECLWTVYALQDRVSRYTGLPRGIDRGNGTVQTIEFFDRLAAQNQKQMCIVSGGVYILFDGTHHLVRNEQGLQTIAFNATNDLSLPPDPTYVRALTGRFDGTIISIRLVLDHRHLEKLTQNPSSSPVI